MLPLLGSILAGFMGRKLGVTGTQIITCTSVILTTILAVFVFFEVAVSNISVYIKLFR
jgi:NADH-ubiquinone oxidoreductase chain 5